MKTLGEGMVHKWRVMSTGEREREKKKKRIRKKEHYRKAQ